MIGPRIATLNRAAYLRRLHATLWRHGLACHPNDPDARVEAFDRLARACPTYGWWWSLREDVGRPDSLLDLQNKLRRRFGKVRVVVVDGETGTKRRETWAWRAFLDRTHVHGNCDVCRHPDLRRITGDRVFDPARVIPGYGRSS